MSQYAKKSVKLLHGIFDVNSSFLSRVADVKGVELQGFCDDGLKISRLR